MTKIILPLIALLGLAACSSNPVKYETFEENATSSESSELTIKEAKILNLVSQQAEKDARLEACGQQTQESFLDFMEAFRQQPDMTSEDIAYAGTLHGALVVAKKSTLDKSHCK